ncbi:MAG: hypothetical protein AB8V23_04600 [Candidatus Midichloria sp.]
MKVRCKKYCKKQQLSKKPGGWLRKKYWKPAISIKLIPNTIGSEIEITPEPTKYIYLKNIKQRLPVLYLQKEKVDNFKPDTSLINILIESGAKNTVQIKC